MSIKLNLACGLDYQEGYINSDLYPSPSAKIDAQLDVSKLPYEDNSVDEIRALHIIEHFDFHEAVRVLLEWNRVLKPNGKLIIETPDFLESCKKFVNDPLMRIDLYGQFFAQPWIPGLIHKFLFTEEQLINHLSWSKFRDFKRIEPVSNYIRPYNKDLFLAMEAYK